MHQQVVRDHHSVAQTSNQLDVTRLGKLAQAQCQGIRGLGNEDRRDLLGSTPIDGRQGDGSIPFGGSDYGRVCA